MPSQIRIRSQAPDGFTLRPYLRYGVAIRYSEPSEPAVRRRFFPEIRIRNTPFRWHFRWGTTLGADKGTKGITPYCTARKLRRAKEFCIRNCPGSGAAMGEKVSFYPPFGASIPPYGATTIGRNTDDSGGYLPTNNSLEEC